MPEVCVHAYRVLELLMARHVPREHNYITDYDIQGYAFPLTHNHALYEAYVAKACTLWLYMPEVCVHAYYVPREHNYIIDYDRDIHFPSLPCPL